MPPPLIIFTREHGHGPWPCFGCGEPVSRSFAQERGMRGVIHHHDRNHFNNETSNLRMMHGKCHIELHADERAEWQWPWRRTADSMRAKIQSGELAGRLPTQKAVCEEYGVGLGAARRAIAYLKAEGLLYSRPGLGVFVKHQEGK